MLLSAFEGAWRVERDIADLRAGGTGRFEGGAIFAPVPDGLRYREDGLLALGGMKPIPASRVYLWRAGAGGVIEVRFEDGRFFHGFRPDEPAPEAEHDCAPDRYLARYDFTAWPCWSVAWRVSGPRKDYDMLTRFAPEPRP